MGCKYKGSEEDDIADGSEKCELISKCSKCVGKMERAKCRYYS